MRIQISLILFLGVSFCGYGQEPAILRHKEKIKITEIEILNSEWRETNLSISPDGKYLYFMSDRGGQPWSNQFLTYKGKPRYDGDIWFGKSNSGVWNAPSPLNSAVNTNQGEDEPMISQDGQFVSYQSWKSDWKTTGGPYYTAELSGDHFKNPVGMGGGIHNFISDEFIKAGNTYATDGAALSADGKLFLVCSGPDYDNNMDVYMSRKVEGTWTYMKKAGISTPGDERSIFIAGDSKTIYFGSDGYSDKNGLDIYKTVINEDDTFEQPINIGAPFNGKQDDYGFIITASGNESYFVRDGDIYFANTTDAHPDLKPAPILLLSGNTLDKNGDPVELHLDLLNPETQEIISHSKSNSKTGEFLFSTPDMHKKYRIVSREPLRLDTFIHIDNSGAYAEKTLHLTARTVHEKPEDVKLKEAIVEKSIVKNFMVHYDNNQYKIETNYLATLNDMASYLLSNPTSKIQIHSHTSASASADYNLTLSGKRMNEIFLFFKSKGINDHRILKKAFGEGDLINDCGDGQPCSEKNQRQNRRTELLITDN